MQKQESVGHALIVLQYRIELHERFFNKDYGGDLTRKLMLIALQQCGIIAQIHRVVVEYGIEPGNDVRKNNRNRLEILVAEGLIGMMLMLNLCDYTVSEIMETTEWDSDAPLNLLIRHVGGLSEVLGGAVKLTQQNPKARVVDTLNVMLAAYVELFKRTGGDVHDLINVVYKRILLVEQENKFFEDHMVEIRTLLLRRQAQ